MATEPDKVDSTALGTLLLVLGFGVLATALAITALVRTQEDEIRAERSETSDEFAALRGAQEADLHLPVAYIDEKAGTVRLPIDRAMEVVVRDLRRNPASATAEAKSDQANGHGDTVAEAAPPAGDTEKPAEPEEPAPARAADKPAKPKAPASPNTPSQPQVPKPPAPPPSPPGARPPAPPAPKAPAPLTPPAPKPPAVPAQPQ